MNLGKKKELAKRTFSVGNERIVFVDSRLEDIKEAITKQDMRDLQKDGAVIIRNIKGRRRGAAKQRRVKGKGPGKIRLKVNKRKKEYMTITRKLRNYITEIVKRGLLQKVEAEDLRKKIRNRTFRSLAHLKEHIQSMSAASKRAIGGIEK